MADSPTVAQLLDRIRAADAATAAAWDDLFARTYDQVKGVVQQVFRLDFAGLRRHTHTTELLHEVERKLLAAVKRGLEQVPTDEEHYFRLVRKITRQACVDMVRYFKQPYRKAGGIPDEFPVADGGPSPETVAGIADALNQLSEDEFDLYTRLLRKQPKEEVQAELGISQAEYYRRRTALEKRLTDLLNGDS